MWADRGPMVIRPYERTLVRSHFYTAYDASGENFNAVNCVAIILLVVKSDPLILTEEHLDLTGFIQ